MSSATTPRPETSSGQQLSSRTDSRVSNWQPASHDTDRCSWTGRTNLLVGAGERLVTSTGRENVKKVRSIHQRIVRDDRTG